MSIREALKAARRFIGPLVEDVSYGFARPDNPHDFSPDRESCTPEEIAAHKAACEAYDRGEYDPRADPTSINAGPLHILRAPWGIGSSTWRDPEAAAALAKIDAALREMDEAKPVAWLYIEDPWGANERHVMFDSPESQNCDPLDWTPLYAAPPAPTVEMMELAKRCAEEADLNYHHDHLFRLSSDDLRRIAALLRGGEHG